VTKQRESLTKAGQADAKQPEHELIEVTPKMIEAGMAELRDHHFGDDPGYVLECVYRAMDYAKRSASNINVSK
jgi:hypothetical protein